MAHTRDGRQLPRQGFTLVELLVALLLFDIALLALAANAAVLVRMHGQLAQRDLGVSAAESRLERLRAAGCPEAASGDSVLGPGQIEGWQVVAPAPPLRVVRESVTVGTPFSHTVLALQTAIWC